MSQDMRAKLTAIAMFWVMVASGTPLAACLTWFALQRAGEVRWRIKGHPILGDETEDSVDRDE